MKKKNTKDSGRTVGEVALDLQKIDDKINPIELQREIHKGNTDEESFEHNVLECLNRGRKEIHGSFYIVVVFKKERLLQNIIRQYFFFRKSCPTPDFDQLVYKYDFEGDKIDFIWVIPDKATCHALKNFGHELPLDQQPLVQYAKDFMSGELDKKCAHFNGEVYA